MRIAMRAADLQEEMGEQRFRSASPTKMAAASQRAERARRARSARRASGAITRIARRVLRRNEGTRFRPQVTTK